MNEYDGFDRIKKELDRILPRIQEKKRDIIYKCPFCGDTDKKDHGHFYLSKVYTWYHCFRCGSKGHINNLLKELKLDKLKIKFNLEKIQRPKIKVFDSNSKFIFKRNLKDGYIVDFLSKRIGLDKEDVIKKIFDISVITDSYSFNSDNELSDNYQIDSDHICFITEKNTKIIKRNIKGANQRYHVLWFTEDFDYYTIKNHTDDFLKRVTRPINVVLGEGIFDVLVPYYRDIFNNIDIFIASGGDKSLPFAVEYLAKKYLNNLNIILLCDWDFVPRVNFFKKRIKKYVNSVSVLINKYSKDFGDPPIQIEKIS